MKASFFIAAMIAAVVPASAQSVTKLSATKANDYGLAYSLPQTVVDITLQAECKVEKPGEFYNYAERYLGRAAAMKAVKEARTSWTLTAAEVGVRGEVPQGAETYLMQFKSGSPVYVLTDAAGTPLAINAESEAPEAAESKLEGCRLSASPLEGSAARYAVTEDMLASSSLAKRAQLAADQIMQLRQSRQDYLTGQADNMPDGKALEMILANINAQEEALTAMFLGTVQSAAAVTKVSYVPATDSQADVVIARLNPVNGFVDADDLTGAPIYLQYGVTERGSLPKTEKGVDKVFPKGGVPYCIPGAANITVEYDGTTVAGVQLGVAQLGVVYGLDPAFFTNKKEPGYVIFDPLTGGIREMGTKNQ